MDDPLILVLGLFAARRRRDHRHRRVDHPASAQTWFTRVGGHEIKLTNGDRVVFPDDGVRLKAGESVTLLVSGSRTMTPEDSSRAGISSSAERIELR